MADDSAADTLSLRLVGTELTSTDVLARLVRTLQKNDLTAHQLAKAMDENDDGELSVLFCF